MSKPIRLTAGMLRAIGCALDELLASPDAATDEAAKIVRDAEKAARWIGQELERRRITSKRLPKWEPKK